MADLEEQATELQRKANIAEQVYDMAIGSSGNEVLREKLVDVMYENEQLKEENSKLKQLLEKAYNFMKQYLIREKNLFELFQEKIGMVLEKVRKDFRR
jgi:regulator of replication initiation timing